jgi:dethiobiotin synthetase
MQTKTIFITGTDTGVGKTLLTGLLLCHLRERGCHALAMKPFCTGERGDVEILYALQDAELERSEINPFYFKRPLAPLVAAREQGGSVHLREVLAHIRKLSRRCQILLIEGVGGLCVPLGPGFTITELIGRLRCRLIVVSRNKLGTINHTLLTARTAQEAVGERLMVAVMDQAVRDPSCGSNVEILAELLEPVPVFSIPFLGREAMGVKALRKNSIGLKKTLARLCR